MKNYFRQPMKTKRWVITIALVAASLLGVGILVVSQSRQHTVSTLDFEIGDFDALHAPVDEDTNEYLIFGNLPILSPRANLAPELAVFLGRWEGYDYSPPVKRDYKLVLVIQEITAQGGTGFLWMGTNLQYPSVVEKIHFDILPGASPAIAFKTTHFADHEETIALAYDPGRKLLHSPDDDHRPIELGRGKTFHVYKDYARYLAGKRIYSKEYRGDQLRRYYGPGYLLYLPEGYEADAQKTWPLIFFLHGYGDRGDNVLVLAKASPFMMIREKGPLPFIIAAPQLYSSTGYNSFSDEYLDEALDEILADYRVDPKRIYMTGLSMGGEATYRFAWHRPKTFAAIAPLAAYFHPLPSLLPLKDMPVWAIHGADDLTIPLRFGQEPVDALQKIGGDVRFSILEGHDHDVWTDTYSDPKFYEWLLQHQKP